MTLQTGNEIFMQFFLSLKNRHTEIIGSLSKFGEEKLHTDHILGLLFSMCLQFRQVLNIQ